MPGFLIPGVLAATSGGVNILSGNIWSGQGSFVPQAGIQIVAHPSNSGFIYFGFSGNLTILSGAVSAAGVCSGGANDGTPLAPGAGYFAPKMFFNEFSGNPQLWVAADAACSGQARLNIVPM